MWWYTQKNVKRFFFVENNKSVCSRFIHTLRLFPNLASCPFLVSPICLQTSTSSWVHLVHQSIILCCFSLHIYLRPCTSLRFLPVHRHFFVPVHHRLQAERDHRYESAHEALSTPAAEETTTTPCADIASTYNDDLWCHTNTSPVYFFLFSSKTLQTFFFAFLSDSCPVFIVRE